MPINRLLRDSKLSSDEIERLNRALAKVLHSIGLVDRNDPIAEIIAKEIIMIGATGVSDPGEISRIAIERLGLPKEGRAAV